jgi:hypothetical protein
MKQAATHPSQDAGPVIAKGVDDEPLATNQRDLGGRLNLAVVAICVAYTTFHVAVMNLYPLETWTYRMIHLAGGLFIGFLIYSALSLKADADVRPVRRSPLELALAAVAVAGVGYGLLMVVVAFGGLWFAGLRTPDPLVFQTFGIPLLVGSIAALVAGWVFAERSKARIHWGDWVLGAASVAVLGDVNGDSIPEGLAVLLRMGGDQIATLLAGWAPASALPHLQEPPLELGRERTERGRLRDGVERDV